MVCHGANAIVRSGILRKANNTMSRECKFKLEVEGHTQIIVELLPAVRERTLTIIMKLVLFRCRLRGERHGGGC